MEPTIFADVEDHMFIAKEESFGPVMVVSKFAKDDVDDVIARANDTEFGLASGVFTNDVNKVRLINSRGKSTEAPLLDRKMPHGVQKTLLVRLDLSLSL